MDYRVYKFGGTSVGDVNSLHKVCQIIKENPAGLCVVVSAMSGMTDLLSGLADAAVHNRRDEESIRLEGMVQRHDEVISKLVGDTKAQADLKRRVRETRDQLKSIFDSLQTLAEITPKALALTVAYGERLLAQIVEAHLKETIAAKFLDATAIIKLSRDLGELSPDIEKIREACRQHLIPLLEQGNVVIIPGFIGESITGELVTLGRGGSDYSATLLGAALQASSVSLYKEVEGLMTADPRYVDSARVIPELHYREAAELAYYGAKVLHPRTIIPLVPNNIPLLVKNTFQPELPGTMIAGDVEPGAYPVKALTAILGQSIVSVEGKGMMGVPGIAGRTFGALAQAQISVSLISQSSSESSICFVVPTTEAYRAVETLQIAFRFELEHRLIDDIRIQSNQAVLAIVGLGMTGTPGIAARAFNSLYRYKINVNAIAQGSSELNISIVIDADRVQDALRSLHREYQLEKLKVYHAQDHGEARLAICGFGQIGQELTKQIESQRDYFRDKLDITCPFVAFADSSGVVVKELGFDSDEIQGFYNLKRSGRKLAGQDRKKISEIQSEMQTKLWQLGFHKSIFVDLTAEETAPLIRQALLNDFHVVLANKKPLAIPMEEFDELFQIAKSRGLMLRYEATVGAGLPVLDTLEKLAGAGDDVFEILGCLSGTLGYLMTEMQDGSSFSEAVRKAYNMGYTEPDPRDDLSGMDVARKALILARTLGFRVNMEDIALEALYEEDLSDDDPNRFIDKLKSLDDKYAERMAKAAKQGKVLRYVARLNREQVSVGIEELPLDSPLGRLRGTDNQVTIRSRRYDANPLIVTGPGAGADVTAAGVLNDIVAIAASQEKGANHGH
ncbi:MAG: bifunctional aspartate kinase/homoserine dehydrogenase I [Oligoflexus sp.]